MLTPVHFLWFLYAAMATVALVKLMRGKQAKLSLILRGYVDVQMEWAKKRAKAVRLAKMAAAEKAAREEAVSKFAANPLGEFAATAGEPKGKSAEVEQPSVR